jgi:hypothetical protein
MSDGTQTEQTRIVSFHVPEDPDLQAAIGRVSILHARLDYVLRLTIKSISGMPLGEAMDATQMDSSRELRRRVGKWGRRRFGESEALITLQAHLQRCQRVSQRRNDLLHSLYAKPIDGEPMVFNRDRQPKPLPSLQEVAEIEYELQALCDEMNGARFDAGYLATALGDAKGPH